MNIYYSILIIPVPLWIGYKWRIIWSYDDSRFKGGGWLGPLWCFLGLLFENNINNRDCFQTHNFSRCLIIFVFFQIFTNEFTDELPPLPANPPNIPSPSLTHAFILKQARLVNNQSITLVLISQERILRIQPFNPVLMNSIILSY